MLARVKWMTTKSGLSARAAEPAMSAEWSMPAFPQIVKGGKNLLLYSGGDEAFVEYELLDDLEEMAAPIADEVRVKVQEWMAGKEAGGGT